jgi:predicted nicotinamide N-methyase
MKIGAFQAELTCLAPVPGETIALWRVADLERHVDRAALLAADDAPEPPYWAHLWSGAWVLAAAVPRGPRTVLELGCGLGLPGLVAARRGARVTFVDREPAALAFVRASAAANGIPAVDTVAADVLRPALRARFELVLAAELLYDRQALRPLAEAIAGHLAPGGRALLADAGRIDTSAFYDALAAAGVAWRAREHAVREEGLPLTVRLVEIAPGDGSLRRGGGGG